MNHYTEYANGFHFMIHEQKEDISDLGFAISKEDGHMYRGLEAHEFLKGDIIGEGDI